MIYNPLKEFTEKYKDQHLECVTKHFDALVEKSGVDIEANHKTVSDYDGCQDEVDRLRRKCNLWRFLRVLMCITLILIPLVIMKITPKIRSLREQIQSVEQKAQALLTKAIEQMAPLNALFTDHDALDLIEKVIPSLSFSQQFTVEQEKNMTVNFDFVLCGDDNESTVDLLSGSYNENPFLFEKRRIHRMGVETYHGYKTIRWTETYRDSDGKTRTRVRTQTLHATVAKPKPFYHTKVALSYCSQGGPDLSFSRDASNLDQMSEKQIDKLVKKGEKKLKKMTDDAIKNNTDFMSMSNSDFEVMFDALDRDNEVQFRTLFTPLAQTNLVDLIRSKEGYGDDFSFVKQRRTNHIVTRHSQGREITIPAHSYHSYSFEVIKNNFTSINVDFFKAVYFDFAPILAVPIYQERPVHSLEPIPALDQKYSYKECEALANQIDKALVVHPETKTEAILRSGYLSSTKDSDQIIVTALSYDTFPRIDLIPVYGGDGRWHDVAVPWDEYIPLEQKNHFFVSTINQANGESIVAKRNDLCIYQ